MPTPYAVDTNKSYIELEYVFEKKGNKMIVSILTPYDWLMDEDRVYPVKIDPSTNADILRKRWVNYDPPSTYIKVSALPQFIGGQIDGSLDRAFTTWYLASINNIIAEANLTAVNTLVTYTPALETSNNYVEFYRVFIDEALELLTAKQLYDSIEDASASFIDDYISESGASL